LSNILVTGGAGLIGAALLRRLAADGHALVATDARKASVPISAPQIGISQGIASYAAHLAAQVH
jgi:nucleoside-diphosphate-sugar epimerase